MIAPHSTAVSASPPGARSPIEIDRGSAEPLYRQLRRALEHQIETGVRPRDLPLPSTRALAQELGLSRNTVSAAYDELLALGLIEGRERSGFFINAALLKPETPGPARTPAPADPPPEREAWRLHLRTSATAQPPEISKITDWADYPYPFVAGQIDAREFPRLSWARALREALEPPHLLYSVRDAVDADDPELVRAIIRHILPARGVRVSPENVLVTTGSQQGLDLLAHALSGPGSTVGVEDPGYVDARHTFLRVGADLRPIPVDGEGLVVPDSTSGIDLLILTPSHQSPTNVTLSRDRRVEVLERTRASGTVVIEDDYDSEFRYQGQPSPALRAHDGAEHVIYLGSFTKFLAPGLRLGYLVADAELVRELRRIRRYRVRHVPGHSQRAMALLIGSGQFQRTLTRRRSALGQKWELLRNALKADLPWPIRFPPGGVSIWVSGPPGFDAVRVAERAKHRGLIIEPGHVFFADPEAHRNHFRMGFAAIDLASIRPGVRVLGQLLT